MPGYRKYESESESESDRSDSDSDSDVEFESEVEFESDVSSSESESDSDDDRSKKGKKNKKEAPKVTVPPKKAPIEPAAAPLDIRQLTSNWHTAAIEPSANSAVLSAHPAPVFESSASSAMNYGTMEASEAKAAPVTIPTISKKLTSVSDDFWKKEVLGTKDASLKPIAARKKLLNGIISSIEAGFVKFRDVQLSFIGSHAQLDSPDGSTVSLKSAAGSTFSRPIVDDGDIEQRITEAYRDIKSGLITKITVKAVVNNSDKPATLKSSTHAHLNTGAHVAVSAKDAMITVPPGANQIFEKPVVVYDLHKCLRDNRHPKELLAGKTSRRKITKEQVSLVEGDGSQPYVLIPPSVANLTKKSDDLKKLPTQVLTKVAELLARESTEMHENHWLLAFIVKNAKEHGYYGEGSDKINPHKAQKIRVTGKGSNKHAWVRVPMHVLRSSLLRWSEAQNEASGLVAVDLDSVAFRVFSGSTASFSDADGTDGVFAGVGQANTKYSSNAAEKSAYAKGIQRTISFTLNITVVPNLAHVKTEQASSEPSGEQVDVREQFNSSFAKDLASASASDHGMSDLMNDLKGIKVISSSSKIM